MNLGGSRLGFWFVPPTPASALKYGCSLIPEYTYGDLYAIGTPTNNQYLVDNGFIKYTVNGVGEGAIGDGTTGVGLMYDPTGTGNYGTDDYIKPGTPWEAYAVQAGSTVIGGADAEGGGQNFTNDALVWQLTPASGTHYAILRGNSSVGYVIVQYVTFPGEPIIRMKMTYQNTTGSTQAVKMMRAVDPDVDVNVYNSYDTQNQRGYGTIAGTDLIYSVGTNSGKPLSILIPGNGFTHNTNIIPGGSWPSFNFDYILSGSVSSSTSDDAIAVAWNIGNVLSGQSVSVCCYYICSNDLAGMLTAIGD